MKKALIAAVAALALAAHRGDLSLAGVRDPPEGVVQKLAAHAGPVFIRQQAAP